MSGDCVTLWIGDAIGPVERACMRSVLRQGHGLNLYCYALPAGVPEGVEVRDAGTILPQDRFFLGSRGSVTPFSDWFRYELQRRGGGTWIDTDMYLVAPLDGSADMLFGEEKPGLINNAVLRLPPESELLRALLDIFERRQTPPGLPWRAWLQSQLHELLHGAPDLRRLPWGATGPIAITAFARKFGVAANALAADVFYPVPWEQATWIVEPRLRLEDRIGEQTAGVHLWNECIKDLKNDRAPRGSFLERLQQEGAL